MEAIQLVVPDVYLIQPRVFGDERGFFFESYNQQQFNAAINRSVAFVQANHSRSVRHVLRGLHYQIKQPQGKLVRVVNGEVYDVAVDLRKGSATFGQWVGEVLSAENKSNSGFLKASHMAFSFFPNRLISYTKQLTIGRLSLNDASFGTIQC